LYSDDILRRLKKWCSDRHLTPQGQREGYLTNLLEEVAELHNAIAVNDIHEVIDAICDISVFAINCRWESPVNRKHLDPLDQELFKSNREKALAMINKLVFYAFSRDYARLYAYSQKACSFLGYNFDKCMVETLKEIESRTGQWSEEEHKFIKDEYARTYKADYGKCK